MSLLPNQSEKNNLPGEWKIRFLEIKELKTVLKEEKECRGQNKQDQIGVSHSQLK